MIKKIQIEAKNIKEAQLMAVKELNAREEDIKIEVIKENKGFLGRISSIVCEASIEINILLEGKKFLTNILDNLNTKYQMEARNVDNEYYYTISSEDNPLLIGRDGRCLDAMLTLLKAYLLKYSEEKLLITLDIGGYRENRKRQLEILATKTAKEVARTKIEVKLKPMNAFERKTIHEKLAEWRDIYTESEGEGENRCLVIKPRRQ